MSEKDEREMQIEDMIFDLLISIGMSPRRRGFWALEYCVKKIVLNAKWTEGAVQLYEEVGKSFDSEWVNVLRTMRYSIAKASETVGKQKIFDETGYELGSAGVKIDVCAFVSMCAKRIRRQCYDL